MAGSWVFVDGEGGDDHEEDDVANTYRWWLCVKCTAFYVHCLITRRADFQKVYDVLTSCVAHLTSHRPPFFFIPLCSSSILPLSPCPALPTTTARPQACFKCWLCLLASCVSDTLLNLFEHVALWARILKIIFKTCPLLRVRQVVFTILWVQLLSNSQTRLPSAEHEAGVSPNPKAKTSGIFIHKLVLLHLQVKQNLKWEHPFLFSSFPWTAASPFICFPF